MAGGWCGDGAVQEQIDSSLQDALTRVRQQLPHGESLGHCLACGQAIAEARRQALPGVSLCITCQRERDVHASSFSGYNRRASKDSQLR